MSYIIPLEGGAANASQLFRIVLGGKLYTFTLTYRTLLQQWSLDCYLSEGTVFLGVILCGGTNLTALYPEFGKLSIVGLEPTLDNLGVANRLVWEQ